MRKQILILFIILPFLACAATTPRKDREVTAMEGGDFTALIEGCGNQLVAGYTYCRKTEGDSAEELLHFVGPITNCKREFCVEFKVYNQDGMLIYGDSLPKKSNRKSISWSKLVKRETFELGDRGFWLYTYRVYWLDKNGNENFSVAQGEIRMRVMQKEYIPLHEVVNDVNFTWKFYTRNGELVKMTTGMRTYVGPK